MGGEERGERRVAAVANVMFPASNAPTQSTEDIFAKNRETCLAYLAKKNNVKIAFFANNYQLKLSPLNHIFMNGLSAAFLAKEP